MTDRLDRQTPPRPYYTIESLPESTWHVVDTLTLRSAAIARAKELAAVSGVRHHVYLACRNGQRKHVFTARPPVTDD